MIRSDKAAIINELYRRYKIAQFAKAHYSSFEARAYCETLFETDFKKFLDLSNPLEPKFLDEESLKLVLCEEFKKRKRSRFTHRR